MLKSAMVKKLRPTVEMGGKPKGKHCIRSCIEPPTALEFEEKSSVTAKSLSDRPKMQKATKRKFGERKGVNQTTSLSNDKGTNETSGNSKENVNSASSRSSVIKIFKEKVPTKRKNFDEVDSICSPAKMSKVSVATTEVKRNKGHSSDGKRKVNCKEKVELKFSSDEAEMKAKQPKLCPKNGDKSNSRSGAEKAKQPTPSNSLKRNKKDNLIPKESKGSVTTNFHKEEKRIEKQRPSCVGKIPPEKKQRKKQTSNLSKKPVVENPTSAKRQTVKSVSLNLHVNALPSTSASVNAADSSDPLALLMMMEGSVTSQAAPECTIASGVSLMSDDIVNDINSSQDPSSDSDEELSDWEDVQDHPVPDTSNKSQLPDKPVEITMDLPDILKKKKKKKAFDWKAYFEQRMRRFKKELAANMHKTHLLCLIAHGIRQNTILNEPTLSALLLSIIPRKFDVKALISEEKQVDSLMVWYKKTFPLDQITFASQISLIPAGSMMRAVSSKSISDARMWVFVFICLLRALGLKVRLILSFQPMPFKPDQITNLKMPSNKGKQSTKGKGKPKGKLKKDQVSENSKSKQNQKSSKPFSSALPSSSSSKSSSESEFEEGSPSLRLKKDLKIKSNRKILSVSSEEEFDCSQVQPTVSKAHDFWMELYVKDKKKWICFDCFKVQFGKPYTLEQSATQPLSYVVGFGNDNSVKDVTPRYAKQWLSQTRKLRVDADWVNDTFSYFDFSSYEERIMEEDDIKSQLMVCPIPSIIGDFKNHPLYALKRHLLKFEAIYPNTAIPLGYIKTEPIYARECVRILHSRDNWLREGRCVRLKEEPYKMVKSRPKWNKPKDNPDELDLELFGEWQTEKYIPPPAVNGKVPKNDYGNVELFQPWMLPKGTVHLKVQGLQRVAKKLGIDVAPAMIGWDYHSGYSHPVMDGWVVCEEFADALLEAWDEDQENQRQREEEKRDKRVYGNWKRLIRGLLIKERLKNKFLEEKTLAVASQAHKEEGDELHFSDAEPALPVEQFWPQNRQEEEKAELNEKIQEYKSQLKKQREKRKDAMKENAECLKEKPLVKSQNQRSPVQKTAKSLSKPNTRNKNASIVKENKGKFISVVSSESSSDEEEEKIIKSQVTRKENNKQNSVKKAVRKPRKKNVSDDEEEDETYIPMGGGRKSHEKDNDSSDKDDSVKTTQRKTRSRQRHI